MATFSFVDLSDFDAEEEQFAFEVIDGDTYLKLGLLDADNTLFIESVISGGRVGFFLSGVEIANALITADYSAESGVRVDGVPDALSVGTGYTIQWTQARPGRQGEQGEQGEPAVPVGRGDINVNVLGSEQGVVRFSVPANLDIGVEARMHFDYKVVDAYYESFLLRFYPSANDYDTGRPIPEGDPKYPENIRIVPEDPFTVPGDYIHELRFTPTYVGDIFISLDLIEREREVPDVELYQFVDVNGNRFVDVDGNVFVGTAFPMFQFVDVNDQRFVDVNDNVFVGFR